MKDGAELNIFIHIHIIIPPAFMAPFSALMTHFPNIPFNDKSEESNY